MNWETYIAIGDSITKGARTYLSYPEVAASILKTKLDKHWDLINISENGLTTIEILRKLDAYHSHLHLKCPGVTSVLIGTNDIKNETEISDFCIAYELLICKIKLFTQRDNVIVIRIPNFPKGVMFPYNYQMNELVNRFNIQIERIAKEHSLDILNFKLEDEDFYDGIHLNKTGVNKCGEQLAQHILRYKGVT